MITNLVIKNFKSHLDTNLKFNNLTILCGQNGVGKSSVLQSLLLLRQSYLHNALSQGLKLNKPLWLLGSGSDILCQNAKNETIQFILETKKKILIGIL